jgi:hypothetical protein
MREKDMKKAEPLVKYLIKTFPLATDDQIHTCRRWVRKFYRKRKNEV